MGDLEGPSKRPRSGGRAVDVRFLVQSKVSVLGIETENSHVTDTKET